MPIVSTFCKKGGVGKTTLLGYLAHYHATQGKTVLVISVDDQNSIFKLFGKDGFIDERQDNYFEHLLYCITPVSQGSTGRLVSKFREMSERAETWAKTIYL